MILNLFYSLQNGGDGSAYPYFMESMKLASFDQEHMSEGWGEPCTGTITLESDTEIRVSGIKIMTKESYFIDKYCEGSRSDADEKEEFLSQFFPNGLPVFSVKTEKVNTTKKYLNNHVFVGEKKVGTVFRTVEKSGQVFEDFLNSQR